MLGYTSEITAFTVMLKYIKHLRGQIQLCKLRKETEHWQGRDEDRCFRILGLSSILAW